MRCEVITGRVYFLVCFQNLTTKPWIDVCATWSVVCSRIAWTDLHLKHFIHYLSILLPATWPNIDCSMLQATFDATYGMNEFQQLRIAMLHCGVVCVTSHPVKCIKLKTPGVKIKMQRIQNACPNLVSCAARLVAKAFSLQVSGGRMLQRRARERLHRRLARIIIET